MAFRVKHGSVDTIAKLGALAGEAQFDQKKQMVALDIASKLRSEQQRVELAEFSVQAQQENAKFQQQWEYEKIKIAQQNDFQMQEQIRMREIEDRFVKDQRNMAEFEAVNKSIDQSDIIGDTEKEKMKLETAMRFNMGQFAPELPKTPGGAEVMKARRGVEDDIVYYQSVLDKYRDDPWWGGGEYDLMVKDAEGNERKASIQDKMIRDYAKSQLAYSLQMLSGNSGAGQQQGVPSDPMGLGGM